MSNANAPAFPTAPFNTAGSGLTKREYVATEMMAIILNGSSATPELMDSMLALVSSAAVKAADALLAELAKS